MKPQSALAASGLCASCVYPAVNVTRRGTVYLRCTAASERPELPKYPALPVLQCAGYTRHLTPPAES